MAEVEETVPQEEAPTVAAASGGRGRGRGAAGRGKKAGRGKMKAKAKAKKGKAKLVAEGAEGVEKPKAEKKLNLKQQVEAEIGSRDIDEVIKEAREEVAKLQAAVEAVQKEEIEFESSILAGRKKMEACTSAVDASVAKEALALEKFKAARTAVIDSNKRVLDNKVELAEEEKALAVLASEGEMRTKESSLRKAKAEAAEAASAAKKALEEAKKKEKDAMESLKKGRQAIEGEEAEERMKDTLAKEAAEKAVKLEAKEAARGAGKSLKEDLKEFDKARTERDKARAAAFKEAAGLGKVKKRVALMDGSAASPSKVAKKGGIQDVD